MATPRFWQISYLSPPGGADYTHHIITGSPGFSDLSTALVLQEKQAEKKQS
jgi:hypothetical protein